MTRVIVGKWWAVILLGWVIFSCHNSIERRPMPRGVLVAEIEAWRVEAERVRACFIEGHAKRRALRRREHAVSR